MADVLALPAPLIFRRRRTLELLALDDALELGAGGEARVLGLPRDPTLVAKLYHAPTIQRARKLALMMEDPPELDPAVAALAWPCDLLLDGRGRFAGFLMPRAEGPRVFEFYNPSTRRRTAPLCHYGVLHRAGANLAAAFEALHARGYVVGDVNESNVLLGEGGAVTLVDTDSFQVRDPDDGTVHRSHVGKPEFTPPELQGLSFAELDRLPEHDLFGLAALLFLLLMEGTHPFASRLADGGEVPPVEERIRRGLFPHGAEHPVCRPPRLAPRFELLDPALQALFLRAFLGGHQDPAARPTAAEWRGALAGAEAALVTCATNPRHRHGPHLDACPWCERAGLLQGRDPFPEQAAPAPPRPARAPRRRVQAAAPAPAPVVAAAPTPPVRLAQTAPGPLAAPPGSVFADAPWQRPALAKLDPELRAALAPGALRSPVAWLAPGVWMLLASHLPALQVLGLFGLMMIFICMVAWGAGPVDRRTLAAAILLLLAAAVLTGPPPWMSAQAAPYDDYPRYDAEAAAAAPLAPAPGPEPAPAPEPQPKVMLGETYTGADLDGAPVLENRADVERRLLELYQTTLWYRETQGLLQVRVFVRPDGTVDPRSVDVSQGLSRPEYADQVEEVLAGMRFSPLTASGGRPASAWISGDVWLWREGGGEPDR
ncbi:MAG TPA: hypothetical protein VF746_16550 [Longimicrobium sp.]|jgi:hypothetical protein